MKDKYSQKTLSFNVKAQKLEYNYETFKLYMSFKSISLQNVTQPLIVNLNMINACIEVKLKMKFNY